MLAQEPRLFQIGELETKSKVPIKTIRYYEELGLIQATKRTAGGFRLFAPDVLFRLSFIKRTQSLGFSLREIGHILQIYDQGEPPCGEVQQKLRTKIEEINHRIETLTTLRTELSSLLQETEPPPQQEPGVICPILEHTH
ncbi:MAG: heavy metal-responsive transcriptional regulator [Cyanothece sp. SIO1E1]|nr:heavy metal-responsive transcriptional regulator [Cyanothece sp. SIO1E1]